MAIAILITLKNGHRLDVVGELMAKRDATVAKTKTRTLFICEGFDLKMDAVKNSSSALKKTAQTAPFAKLAIAGNKDGNVIATVEALEPAFWSEIRANEARREAPNRRGSARASAPSFMFASRDL